MNAKELKEVLLLVNNIYVQKWQILVDVVNEIKNNNAEILNSAWSDKFKQNNPEYYPLKLNNIDTWSTFERCVNFNFSIESNKLRSDIIIWDGNSFDGFPTTERFRVVLYLPDSFILKLSNQIEWKFNLLVSESYDKYLEKKRLDWMAKEKKKLLKGKQF